MTNWSPDCMSSGEYDDWLEGARRDEAAARITVCHDCEATYRESMAAVGRCNQVYVAEPDPVRRRWWREAQERRRNGEAKSRRSSAEIMALADEVADMRATGLSWAAIGRDLSADPSYLRHVWSRRADRGAA